jgi:DNA-binding response OmpR family regulator
MSADAADKTAHKRMIVICDDNVPLVMLMQHLLTKQGFSVATAGDGAEGLDLIRSIRPDLLLLDLAMPQRDGLGVLSELQGLEGKRPYTIVVSGQEGTDVQEKTTALGADELWRKPFNVAELIAKIEGLIQKGTI